MITIKGPVHHLLGPLQPAEHDVPQFAQLYIIDSMDAQVTACLAALGATGAALHQSTLAGLHQMLHDHNTFVQRFKQVMDMPAHDLPQWEVVRTSSSYFLLLLLRPFPRSNCHCQWGRYFWDLEGG